MTTSIQVRSIKLTIPIPDASFPWSIIPPKGTPGAKNAVFALSFQTQDGVTLVASLKGAALQKFAESRNAAPGGTVVLSGKLCAENKVIEVGGLYQPPKIEAVVETPKNDSQELK